MNQSLLDALAARLDEGAILTGAAVSTRATSWIDPAPLQAAAILRPRTTEQVAEILSLCHATQQPLVTQGGRTNLVDATHTTGADLVLSLERMADVEEIDGANQTMTVQAGAPLQRVQEAAAAAGLLFPLDLGARGSATIGGCAATNAGGVRVLRYGMMRALVLGMEVVLADGTTLTSLNRMLKNNAGYDLKQLFIGSEGTLGVITRLVLRLFPAPGGFGTALIGLHDFPAAVALLHSLQHDLAGELASFEVMWNAYYRLTTTPPAPSTPPLPPRYPLYVLAESLGADTVQTRARFELALGRAQEQGLFEDAVVAASASQRDALWRIRDDSEQIEKQHALTFGFDVSLPIGEMAAYVEQVTGAMVDRFGAESRCWVYGHVADGNLHVNVWAPAFQVSDRQTVEEIIYQPLRAIGGSISAEHGIGLEKKAYLNFTRTDAEIELMRRLKQTLDPHWILNPGKIID